jgi:addiction module RelE/StbE family toxin
MEVILSHDAAKQYEKLPSSVKTRIRKKLQLLEESPSAGKKLMGQLQGIRSLRVWPYRIIYEINERKKRVEVHKIAHRQGVYK